MQRVKNESSKTEFCIEFTNSNKIAELYESATVASAYLEANAEVRKYSEKSAFFPMHNITHFAILCNPKEL